MIKNVFESTQDGLKKHAIGIACIHSSILPSLIMCLPFFALYN